MVFLHDLCTVICQERRNVSPYKNHLFRKVKNSINFVFSFLVILMVFLSSRKSAPPIVNMKKFWKLNSLESAVSHGTVHAPKWSEEKFRKFLVSEIYFFLRFLKLIPVT